MKAIELFYSALIALGVFLLGIGIYDHYVRRPATLRLAVVDVAKLYAQAQQQATRGVLEGDVLAGRTQEEKQRSADTAMQSLTRNAKDFGPQMERTLIDLSNECHCTLVAMAAVFGADGSVPDFTAEAARRLGLEVHK